jgi:hypothetical protein
MVTSKMLMASLAGLVSPGSAVGVVSTTEKKLTLHFVLEIDADEPSSHCLFLRRADSARGEELLELVMEEIGHLFSHSLLKDVAGACSCTVDIVLVTHTWHLRNQQSAASNLFRLVSEQVIRLGSSEGDSDLPIRPPWLKTVRVHLADQAKWMFAPLQVLLDGGATRGVASIDVRAVNAYVVWLRDMATHTQWITQLGHLLHPFVTHPAAPLLGVVDLEGCLLLDVARGNDDLMTRTKTTGVTVSRTYLRQPKRSPTEILYSHLTRQMWRLSCGDHPNASRLIPSASPVIMIRLGSSVSVSVLPPLATTEHLLPTRPSTTCHLARLVSYVTMLHIKSSPGVKGPSTGGDHPTSIFFCGVFGGVMLTRPLPYSTSEELLVALREQTAIMDSERDRESSETSVPMDGATATWKDVFAKCTVKKLDAMVTDPLVRSIFLLKDRNNMESELRRLMPLPGTLSRRVYVAEDAHDGDGAPTTKQSTYVQELSPSSVMDMLDGTVKTPRTIAAAQIAAAQAAASALAPPSPSQETGKKKKGDSKS